MSLERWNDQMSWVILLHALATFTIFTGRHLSYSKAVLSMELFFDNFDERKAVEH